MKQKHLRRNRHPHREKGVALILALFLMLAMSAVGASMMFLSQTESYSSQNYRLMSQARYGAESGIQVTANYLLYTYASPTTASVTDPITAYVTTASPVTYNGNPVILSANSSVASNYPIATVKTAFTNAVAGTLANGTTNVSYKPYAKLMSMEEVPASQSLSGVAYTIQTWQIVSDGNIAAGARNAQVEVTATLDTQKTSSTSTQTFQYGAFATGATCGAIQLKGQGGTDSYTWNNGGHSKTAGHAGNVGTNGNLTESGQATVDGSLSTPRVGVGSCSNGNVDAETSSGQATVTGGIVHLPQAVVVATPPAPNPLPPTGNVTYNSSTILTPGSYADIQVTGNSTVLHLTAGTYTINSLTLAAQSTLQIDSGPVILNVAGVGQSSPVDLSGGSETSCCSSGGTSYDSSMLQIEYAGTGNIKLTGQGDMTAVIYAPNAPVTFTGNGSLYGAAIASTITNTGNGYIHFDANLANNTNLFLTTFYSKTPTMLSAFSWKTF